MSPDPYIISDLGSGSRLGERHRLVMLTMAWQTNIGPPLFVREYLFSIIYLIISLLQEVEELPLKLTLNL